MSDSPNTNDKTKTAAPTDNRGKLIEALMALLGERKWEDITIADIARRADLTLADFRDCFPSKGAMLSAFSRQLDRTVLENVSDDLLGEPARDRLFDVLMRRIDAMEPYRDAIREIREWIRRDPLSAVALNSVALNSMRFMLEAANIESEGVAGNLKLQGLVIAWSRVVDIWLNDESEQLEKTMAALDRELERGGRLVARAEDLNRLAAPFKAFAGALLAGGRRFESRVRERWPDRRHGQYRAEPDDRNGERPLHH